MRRRAHLWALLGYLFVSLAFTFPLILRFASAIPGDGFDGWQNYWNLWWLKLSLIERHSSPYFTDLLYYPAGVSLLFHTLNPFNGLISLPIQLSWGLLPAYNFAVLFSFVAGGFGAYLLARTALGPRGSRLAAFLAGLVFTFAPYHIAHLLGHLQLIALEWLPFYALYVLRLARPFPNKFRTPPRAATSTRAFVRELPVKDILLCALFLVLVALCDWYYVLYCFFYTLLVFVWLVARSVLPSSRAQAPESQAANALATRRTPPDSPEAVGQSVGPSPDNPESSQPYPGHRLNRTQRENDIAQVGAGSPRWAMPGEETSPLRGSHHGGRLELPPARVHLRRLARFTVSMLVAGTLFLLVVSPVLLPMLREARANSYMVPSPEDSRTFSADLLAFVTPQEFQPIWGRAARGLASSFTATVAEHQVFAGYAVLLLACMGVWSGLRHHAQKARQSYRAGDLGGPMFWLAVGVTFFLLALGPVLHVAGKTQFLPGGGEIHLPYAWLAQIVPFMNISRSVSRFDVMVMLALGVLCAFGWQTLNSKPGRRVAAGGAVLLVLFEFWPAPYPLSTPDTPAWYATLAKDQQQGAVLNLPMNWDRPSYLLYQTVHGKPLPAGYVSRIDPRALVERAPLLEDFRHLSPDINAIDPAAQGQQVLHDLGVRWVVLDRYQMPGESERSFNEELVRRIFAGQQPVFADERLTVYEVKPGRSAAMPYAVLGTDWGAEDPANNSRFFTGEAELDVRAAAAGPAILVVTLAPGSPPLDAGPGPTYRFGLTLSPGSNLYHLRAEQPDQTVDVRSVQVVPG